MPSLADLLENYRNWKGRQEWQSGKEMQDYFGGDPVAQEQFEQLSGFGTGSHGLGGIAGTVIGESGAVRAGFGNLLKKAKQMAESGAKDTDIFKETRSFVGPNGEWMHEISDANAKIIQKGKDYRLEHPGLEAAYPDASKVPIKQMPNWMMGEASGLYAPHLNKLTWMLGDKGAVQIPKGSDPDKGTVLHEFQHWVQNHPENQWEYGSNTRMYTPEKVMQQANDWSGRPEDLSPELESNIRAYGIEKNQKPFSAYEMYKRHWPEAMARNTTIRMNLPEDQLAQLPWYETLNVPRDELVSLPNGPVLFGKKKGLAKLVNER